MLNRNELSSSFSSVTSLTEHDTGHIKQAIEICNQGLGQDYIQLDTLMNYLTDPELHINQAFIWEDVLRGILIGSVMSEEEKETYDADLQKFSPEFSLVGNQVGLIKSIVVEEQYRHHGIGTYLTLQALRRFEQLECNDLFSVSWISNREDNSQRMFEKLGFNRIGQIDEYWTEESIAKDYNCPVCGNPCVCSAAFYFSRM